MLVSHLSPMQYDTDIAFTLLIYITCRHLKAQSKGVSHILTSFTIFLMGLSSADAISDGSYRLDISAKYG